MKKERMIKGNYHTHACYCDGKESLRRYVETAVERGFLFATFATLLLLLENKFQPIMLHIMNKDKYNKFFTISTFDSLFLQSYHSSSIEYIVT